MEPQSSEQDSNLIAAASSAPRTMEVSGGKYQNHHRSTNHQHHHSHPKKSEKKKSNALTSCSNPRTESVTSDASEDGDRRLQRQRNNNKNQHSSNDYGKGEHKDNNNKIKNYHDKGDQYSFKEDNSTGDYHNKKGERRRTNSINAKFTHRIGKSSSSSSKQYPSTSGSKSASNHCSSSSNAKDGCDHSTSVSSSTTQQQQQLPTVYYNQDAAACRQRLPNPVTSTLERSSSKGEKKKDKKPRSRRESENQHVQQHQPQQHRSQDQHQTQIQRSSDQHHQSQQPHHAPPLKETSWRSFEERSPPSSHRQMSTITAATVRPQSAHATSLRTSVVPPMTAAKTSSMGLNRHPSLHEEVICRSPPPPPYDAGPDMTSLTTTAKTSSLIRHRNSSMHEEAAFKSLPPPSALSTSPSEVGPDLTAIRRQRVHSVHIASLEAANAAAAAAAARAEMSGSASDVPPPVPPRAHRPNSATPTSASKGVSTTPNSKPTTTTASMPTSLSPTAKSTTTTAAHRMPPPLPPPLPRDKSESPSTDSVKRTLAGASSSPIRQTRLSSGSPASDLDQRRHPSPRSPTHQQKHSQCHHQPLEPQQHVRAPQSRRTRPVTADVESEVTVVRPTSSVATTVPSATSNASAIAAPSYYPEITVMSTGYSACLSASDHSRNAPSPSMTHPVVRVRDQYLQEALDRVDPTLPD